MALIPRLVRPSVFVRRQAMYKGVLGNSWFWRVIAGFVFGRSLLKRVFGRQPEHLGRVELRPDRAMMIQTITPLSRRERRRAQRAGRFATASDRRREAQALAMVLSKADD